jgi:uncharacterized protein YcbK (DUF882 family)
MKQHTQENRTAEQENVILSRRRFIKNLACGSLLTLGSPLIAHAARESFPSHKTIALQNLHGDRLKLTYFEKGRYIRPALQEIAHVLRDYRTGDRHPIDPALVDLLHDLKQTLEVEKPFQIICGYRSPVTNARRHHESAGVASHSLHMEGKAIDIRIEGVSTRHIRNAALALGRGGVGYYSDFVHVDTGTPRTW